LQAIEILERRNKHALKPSKGSSVKEYFGEKGDAPSTRHVEAKELRLPIVPTANAQKPGMNRRYS